MKRKKRLYEVEASPKTKPKPKPSPGPEPGTKPGKPGPKREPGKPSPIRRKEPSKVPGPKATEKDVAKRYIQLVYGE